MDQAKENTVRQVLALLFQLTAGNLSFRLPSHPDTEENNLFHHANTLAGQLQLYVSKHRLAFPSILQTAETAPAFASETHANHHLSDTDLAKAVHDLIMSHRSEPLPALKELARYFNTNDFRLKKTFREAYGSGIYHYYTTERLRQAHQLITSTRWPLKNIAFECGYGDYVTFAKAFRKEFGCSPGRVERPDIP